ncbi:hypothetical protein QFW80_06555 [Luteimonas sp. M1R5S18]|jgi:hypothetical protein|uniref:Uncharacterized protein n=1 Tax=Luteimonas rhizosphaericola TaxID=3042024 RepID=A0ABT6JHN1_9GAMM|nr:hypothetical protein [Luteimonas rhizosphaericola]MDH5830178.1 hypothetical protein [Luteimonas rhizosphaericola]
MSKDKDSGLPPDAPGSDQLEREQRSYPHGSGDRNSWSPFGKDRMPIHEGGTQRHAPPEPEKRPPATRR